MSTLYIVVISTHRNWRKLAFSQVLCSAFCVWISIVQVGFRDTNVRIGRQKIKFRNYPQERVSPDIALSPIFLYLSPFSSHPLSLQLLWVYQRKIWVIHEKKTTSFETSLETFTKLCATLGTDGTHSCRRRLHQASSGVVEGVEVARALPLALVPALSHAGSPVWSRIISRIIAGRSKTGYP